MSLISYLFWPNPPQVTYENPKVIGILLVSLVLVIASGVFRHWRQRQENPVTRKLSKSWPRAAMWFGLTAVFLTVCRAEGISYLSMRFLWIIWIVVLVFYLFVQIRLYRTRHYEVMKSEKVEDPREKYLPKKRKKK